MSAVARAGGARAARAGPFDVEKVRAEFPILSRKVHGRPLVYLDSAATTQKPRAVIDAERRFYEEHNANIHRGVHWLSERATEDFEGSRSAMQRFLNAADAREVVFVRGATEAINLVAQSWGRRNVGKGDEIAVSALEHHSNIVPWQMLCEEKGAHLRVIPVSDAGELDLEAFERMLSARTRLVAVTHVSNALGTVNPVERVAQVARAAGAAVLVDGAQAAPHLPLDVQELGCDFYALSGHKMYGPTGIGVLWGRAELLEAMPPWQGGGDMISHVAWERTTYNRIPHKFEAGTPNIAGAVGLGAAVEFLESLGRGAVAAHERDLLAHGTRLLSAFPGLRIVGTAADKAGVLSFVLDGVHPHDIGTILDREGIAIRTGHHCAQPAMERFGLVATARASLGVYNTREELDALARGLERVGEVFRR